MTNPIEDLLPDNPVTPTECYISENGVVEVQYMFEFMNEFEPNKVGIDYDALLRDID